MSSGLFGIEHTNRSDKQHWTKNCFNSSFPTALACYMMENKKKAIYAHLGVVGGELKIVCDEIEINELFRCGNKKAGELFFHFETKFKPYQQYCTDALDSIDLVVKDLDGNYLAPVEVKLTVLPSSATSTRPETEWGSEIVVRTATTSYLAIGIWDQVKLERDRIRDIFEDTCAGIGSWTNDYEMAHKTSDLKTCLETFEKEFLKHQRPLVMQPLWKTNGQSPILDDDAFDIVVWSDMAFSRLFIDTESGDTMSRPMRATARMSKCLWELSKSGRIRIDSIYRQMTFNQQNDKEVAPSGTVWRGYITSNRVVKPCITKDEVNKIILSPGYFERLKPERRLDQTLYMYHMLEMMSSKSDSSGD